MFLLFHQLFYFRRVNFVYHRGIWGLIRILSLAVLHLASIHVTNHRSLAKCHMLLNENIDMMDALNSSLPQEHRLEPFVWTTGWYCDQGQVHIIMNSSLSQEHRLEPFVWTTGWYCDHCQVHIIMNSSLPQEHRLEPFLWTTGWYCDLLPGTYY